MEHKSNKVSAAILAGGKSSRMGSQCKTKLKYLGHSFLNLMLEKINGFEEKIVVAAKTSDVETGDFKVVYDDIPGMGPLCAIYTALSRISNEKLLVLPVDTPLIPLSLLMYLIEISEGYDAVIPRDGKHYQPLCAVYSKSCLPAIEQALDKGETKPIDLYQGWNVKYVTKAEIEAFGTYEEIFRNVNTPKDYDDLIKQ